MALQSMQDSSPTSQAILARLDAVMRELQALRQTLLVAQPAPNGSVVDRLWGALGQGTTDELADLDHDIYLELFGNESAR
jgi:hypothetical protein